MNSTQQECILKNWIAALKILSLLLSDSSSRMQLMFLLTENLSFSLIKFCSINYNNLLLISFLVILSYPLDSVLQKGKYSYHKFQFVRILYKCMLMIFVKKQIHSLPMHYLLDCWTISVTIGENEWVLTKKLEKVQSQTNSSMWFFVHLAFQRKFNDL